MPNKCPLNEDLFDFCRVSISNEKEKSFLHIRNFINQTCQKVVGDFEFEGLDWMDIIIRKNCYHLDLLMITI